MADGIVRVSPDETGRAAEAIHEHGCSWRLREPQRRTGPDGRGAPCCARPRESSYTQPGDVLLRDVRIWHRGVPNPSNRPRHMIALILSQPSGESRYRLKFGRGCESALEGRDADANAEYLHGPIDYLFDPSYRIFLSRARTRMAKVGTRRGDGLVAPMPHVAPTTPG